MKTLIEELWDARDTLSPKSMEEPEIKQALMDAIDNLDTGKIRVAQKKEGQWVVNEWVKKAILLFLKTGENYVSSDGAHRYFDKVPLKFEGWDVSRFKNSGMRIVPGATVRKGCFIEKNSTVMPAFVNIGAHIGQGCFIDTWASIGNCAQIGKNCHIGSGVSISSVLEPLHTLPVIIEDNCSIGAKCDIGEGVIIEEGSVLAPGVCINHSTKIYIKESDEFIYGRIPPKSIAVSGSIINEDGFTTSNCVIISEKVMLR